MESYDNRPIGVFDSGLGGLTVVTYLSDLLPDENFIYFGDTARTPYGSKSVDTIKKFSVQIADFSVDNHVKAIVIACNTVSATCMELLKNRYPGLPVVGMITPTARYIVEQCDPGSTIGVIGTKVTVESHQYEKAITKCGGKFKVRSKACPLFVPVIEEGVGDTSVVQAVIGYYLNDFIKENAIDTLVLGCTHYPLLEEEIRTAYGNLSVVNPSKIVAEEVKQYLWDNNMLALENGNKSAFYASDISDEFVKMARKIIKDGIFGVRTKKFY